MTLAVLALVGCGRDEPRSASTKPSKPGFPFHLVAPCDAGDKDSCEEIKSYCIAAPDSQDCVNYYFGGDEFEDFP